LFIFQWRQKGYKFSKAEDKAQWQSRAGEWEKRKGGKKKDESRQVRR
jgi:hypothetical protein